MPKPDDSATVEVSDENVICNFYSMSLNAFISGL
jgi:hypothetical protein